MNIEYLLGRTLWIGIVASTSLLAAGLFCTIAVPRAPADALLHAGLLVLMATPVARVVVTLTEYVRERDWFFATSALAVLVVISLTILEAWRR